MIPEDIQTRYTGSAYNIAGRSSSASSRSASPNATTAAADRVLASVSSENGRVAATTYMPSTVRWKAAQRASDDRIRKMTITFFLTLLVAMGASIYTRKEAVVFPTVLFALYGSLIFIPDFIWQEKRGLHATYDNLMRG